MLCLLLVLSLSLAVATAQVNTPAQERRSVLKMLPKELLERAALSKLWHLLLHYEDGFFSSSTRSDGKAFFLSSERTPLPELKANIEALFVSTDVKPDQHFLCRFPARARFILDEIEHWRGLQEDLLSFPLTPQPQCPAKEQFLRDTDIHGLELIYASASFTQNASMFGHTMLHILRSPSKPALEDPVISFVAKTTVGGFMEIIYGLLGRFAGVIEIANLSQRILNYTVLERRNLWSFKLKIPQKNLTRFAAHLWEMNSTFFYYHFFHENCAFYNQTLLQIALPEIPLREEMSIFSLPLEAVRAVTQHPDLIEQISFYPSAYRIYEEGWNVLSSAERVLVERVLVNSQPILLPPERAALVYMTALNARLMKTYQTTLKVSDEERKRLEALYTLLASLQRDPQITAPDHTTPLVGAGPHSLVLGGGVQWNGAPFLDLELRPILHERDENSLSYERFNEIVFLKGRLRYLHRTKKLRLNQFTLASLYNMKPWTLSGPMRSMPISWAFDVGLRDSSRFGRNGLDSYFEVDWGLTLPLWSIGGISLLGGPLAEWSIKNEVRVGVQGLAQLTLYPFSRWTFSIRVGSRYLDWSTMHPDLREDWGESALNLFVGSNLTLNLRAKITRVKATREIGFDLRLHWF
jgi:hypothetical protein